MMLKNIWNAIKAWFGSEPLRSQFEAIVEEQKKVEAKIENVVAEVETKAEEVVEVVKKTKARTKKTVEEVEAKVETWAEEVKKIKKARTKK
jgi:uncharacterized protein YdcH (DUF465 family)